MRLDILGMSKRDAINALLAQQGEPPMPIIGGYAAQPGSGPYGEKCKTCKHKVARHFAKTYWKCGLIRYTGGPKTDIKLKSAACEKWEKEDA